jgi:hypothetical protein
MPDANSYVYVIGCPPPATGPVKIGWTSNPQVRLHQLRTDTTITPEDVDRTSLQVLYSCEGDRALERALHLRFHRLRVIGEWFRLNPAVAPREVRMAISEIPDLGIRKPDEGRSQTLAVQVTGPIQLNPVQAGADRHHQLFTAWISAGFTEEQALRMVVMLAGGG